MARHCPDCGFVNAEGANYCQKCGAFVGVTDAPGGDPVTATYRVGDTGELIPVDLETAASEGPVLVIRSGGGRVGESFPLDRDRMTIGRRPDSDVFLDDVTGQLERIAVAVRDLHFATGPRPRSFGVLPTPTEAMP